jgi:hypothetical protein
MLAANAEAQMGATDFKTGTSDVVSEGEYWIEK